jgi:hypothetical protein
MHVVVRMMNSYSQDAPKRALKGADRAFPTNVPRPSAAVLTTDPITDPLPRIEQLLQFVVS